MNTTRIIFNVEVWKDGRWCVTAEVDHFDEAHQLMTASVQTTGTKARIIEVRTVVSRTIVGTAKNLGSTDAEIVRSTLNHEGGF